jgi:DNA-binding SARP family transcriptional activator
MEGYLVAYTTCAMGNTHRLMGQPKKAEVLIKQAIAMAEERGEHYELGLYLTSLGVLKYQGEESGEAIRILSRACRLLRRSGNRREMVRAYLHLANVLFRRKRFSQATRYLEVASQVLAELGYDDFILPEAAVLSSLIQFAASKRIGGTRFIGLKDKLVSYQLLVSKPVSRGEYPPLRVSLPEVKAYGFGQSVVFLEARRISDIEWRSKKAKEMLFYLLVHPPGRTKEQILEALWPELSIANQNSCFHSTVYRLRRALYQGCLVYQDGWYRLHPEGEFWFDAEEFEQLLKQAHHLPPDSDARLSCLEKAIDLYTGPFLADFYSEWCETLRLNFEMKYVRALSTLAGHHAAKGDWERCIELLERILAVDIYNEEAHYKLIKAYTHLGDSASALKCYHNYTDILREQLDAEPSPKIALLYHQILGSQRG